MNFITKRSKLLFAAYVLLMLFLLFGQRIGWMPVDDYGAALRERINAVPFQTIGEYLEMLFTRGALSGRRLAFINLAGNVVMFVPLGYFLPVLWKNLRHFLRCMCWAAGIILGIECIQLFTLLGSFDVDDLLLNLLGVGLGYGLYWLGRRLADHRKGKINR